MTLLKLAPLAILMVVVAFYAAMVIQPLHQIELGLYDIRNGFKYATEPK